MSNFEAELYQRRGIFPTDPCLAAVLEEYQQALANIDQGAGTEGEQEAIEAWLQPVQTYAKKLLNALEQRGNPPLEERGELFRQSVVGVIACARERRADPAAKWASYKQFGEAFFHVLEMLCQMHPRHLALFEHPHAWLSRRRLYQFQLLCMRWIELLQQKGSKRMVYDDLLSLLTYWKIEIPIALSSSGDVSEAKLKARLRQWVCRVRKAEAKSAPDL